jgi:hypothetical protein
MESARKEELRVRIDLVIVNLTNGPTRNRGGFHKEKTI